MKTRVTIIINILISLTVALFPIFWVNKTILDINNSTALSALSLGEF